jgi:hypothetical protein
VAKKSAKRGSQSITPPPAPKRSAAVDIAGQWPRLLTVAVISALAFLLPGIVALPGLLALRGLLAGLVAGLASRTWREYPWVLGAGTLGTLVAALAVAGSGVAGQAPASGDVVMAVALSLAVAAAFGAASVAFKPSRVAWVALAVTALVYLAAVGVLPGPIADGTAASRASFGTEPVAEQYGFDGFIFLRTEFLLEKGVPYYDAFLQAFHDDSRLDSPPPGLFNIRQPWLFWIWRYLPGPAGTKVWGWFIVWALGTASAAYLLARRFLEPAAALLAPIAVLGYLIAPTYSTWLTLSEFWGGCMAVWFLAAMVYKRWTLGACLMVLAFATRELMLFLVPVYLVWWVLAGRPKAGIPGLVISFAGPAVLVGLHAWWSPVHGQSAGVSNWLNGGIDKLLGDLKFMGDYVPFSSVLYPLVPVAGLTGALLTRPRWAQALLATAVLVPVIALTVFSSPAWGEYWGAIAMPSLLALMPLAAVRLMPGETSEAQLALG